MITCKLYGGLGNQLFQIATTISHAIKNGVDYKIPEYSINTSIWKTYIHHLPKLLPNHTISGTYNEPSHNYNELPFQDGMCLDGYFQSERYFKDHRKEVLEALNFKWKPFKKIVSIHVRRGDYLKYPTKHPVVTINYIDWAIKHFKSLGYKRFMVFSDDMEWCRENINSNTIHDSCIFSYSEGNSNMYDLTQMSQCEHHIIANSSFSWWGAWLNQNPDKIVIAPLTWFGPDNAHLNTSDLIPSSWTAVTT
jgi:hypothetical protein